MAEEEKVNRLASFTDEQRDYFRERFVGNECDTDEYRETQPQKGMNFYAQLLELVEDGPPEQVKAIVEMGRIWHNAMIEKWGTPGWLSVGYAGADELMPILSKLFDLLWAQGDTPYGDTVEDLQQEWEER